MGVVNMHSVVNISWDRYTYTYTRSPGRAGDYLLQLANELAELAIKMPKARARGRGRGGRKRPKALCKTSKLYNVQLAQYNTQVQQCTLAVYDY